MLTRMPIHDHPAAVLESEPGRMGAVVRLLRRFTRFEVGAFGPLLIRREVVRFGLGRRVRVLYASDLHCGHWWTRTVPDQLVDASREASPDLILLGGDLVDRADALTAMEACIRRLSRIAPVAAVPGNHDTRCGLVALRDAVLRAGGCWLPDSPMEKPLGVDARISALARTAPRVLCAHYPDSFPAAARAGYRLVLAGHLHGGQCVVATRNGRQYPAAWIHRWHGLRFSQDDALMLVSRGAADTFPLRFNCPREVIVCEIE